MKLLFFISESFPTFRVDVTTLFGKYLPRLGVFADIVTLENNDFTPDTTWPGHLYLAKPPKLGILKHFKKFLHFSSVLLTIERDRYDAIQVRDMPFMAVICLIFSRFKKLPFYYWMSYPIPEGQISRAKTLGLFSSHGKGLAIWIRGQVGKYVLYHIIIPAADHVFVQSNQMKIDVLESAGIDSLKVTPVVMGVDIEALVDIPQHNNILSERLHSEQRVLVYLGTLDRIRRIDVLFPMMLLIKQRIDNVKLILVGDTHDKIHRSWLNQKIKELNLTESVEITGWLPAKDAWNHVLTGEIALSPFPRSSILDSASPTKVPEYLALGLPVVCNPNPDQYEIISKTNAGICVEYSPECFADAVMILLNEPAEKKRDRVNSGLKYVRNNRDYKVIALFVSEIYKSILPKKCCS